jgi:hypothetical protein
MPEGLVRFGDYRNGFPVNLTSNTGVVGSDNFVAPDNTPVTASGLWTGAPLVNGQTLRIISDGIGCPDSSQGYDLPAFWVGPGSTQAYVRLEITLNQIADNVAALGMWVTPDVKNPQGYWFGQIGLGTNYAIYRGNGTVNGIEELATNNTFPNPGDVLRSEIINNGNGSVTLNMYINGVLDCSYIAKSPISVGSSAILCADGNLGNVGAFMTGFKVYGTTISSPLWGNPVKLPKNFGIVIPVSDTTLKSNPVSWLPSSSHFGNAVTLDSGG